MDVSERWGNSIEEAVEYALADLGVTRDEVEIEVLEQPSKGFFGLGSKLAKVKVSKKVKPEPVKQEPVKAEPVAEVKTEEKAPEVKVQEPQAEPLKKREAGSRYDNKKRNQKGKSHGKSRNEKRDYDKIVESNEPILPAIDMDKLDDVTDHPALTFLNGVVKEMGLEITVTGKTDGKDIFLFLDGKDSGTVIGKRGATLDAIQYLTSLVVNKEGEEYVRVVVDAENYRAKREKSLEKLAMRLADKVAKSRRSYKLEPMNPYERKVIHATLQKDNRVVTRSEGQDPYRRVIIELKED